MEPICAEGEGERQVLAGVTGWVSGIQETCNRGSYFNHNFVFLYPCFYLRPVLVPNPFTGMRALLLFVFTDTDKSMLKKQYSHKSI